MNAKILVLAAATALTLPSAAFGLPTTVLTDVALRTGPGPAYPVIGTIDRQAIVEVEGCVDAATWCQVSWNGRTGWTYAAYLAHEIQGRMVVVPEVRTQVQVPTVVYQEQRASTVVNSAPVFVGDPIVGPSLGTLKVGTVIQPPPAQVQTYVTTQRIEPVYLQGEVVVGAILPRSVMLYDIPQSPYRYTYVNGRTVLVDPQTNQIVYVYY